MTTEEKIKVMQASIEGKQIQVSYKGVNAWEDMTVNPSWDWNACDYRVKPEAKYRPFKDCNELIEYWENNYCQHRPKNAMPLIWVKPNNGLRCYGELITEFWEYGVCVGTESLEKPFHILFENFTFLDGSPCGVVDEN